VNEGAAIRIDAGETIRSIELFSIAGQKIKILFPYTNRYVFPVTGLATGIYLVKVQTENKITVMKIPVQ
jgi:hypothetical protein